MMTSNNVKVAVVGCGNIAKEYAEQIRNYDKISLVGFFDLQTDRAEAFAKTYGGTVYQDLAALLADPAIDVVVNLTIHHAHVDVITRCLNAGKHVYTEKPFAMRYEDATRLMALAEEKGLRLSSAPITYMGEAQQTAWKTLRDGKLGPIRLAYAELNHGRIETWHPNPVPFYDVGIVWDVGIYPITLLTTFLGPAHQITAFGRVVYPDRETLGGEAYRITTPDVVIAMIEFESGTLARLSCNFYTTTSPQGASLEFHGDAGSLYLGNCFRFETSVAFLPFGTEIPHHASASTGEPVPLLRTPFEGVEFGRGLQEFANAICEDRPHRASAAHAAHVVDIIEAIHRSIDSGNPISITSRFPSPAPMDWAV